MIQGFLLRRALCFYLTASWLPFVIINISITECVLKVGSYGMGDGASTGSMGLSSLMVLPLVTCQDNSLDSLQDHSCKPSPQLLLPSVLGSSKESKTPAHTLQSPSERAAYLKKGQSRGHISWGSNHSTPQSSVIHTAVTPKLLQRNPFALSRSWGFMEKRATRFFKPYLWWPLRPHQSSTGGRWSLREVELGIPRGRRLSTALLSWQDSRAPGGIHTVLTLGSSLRGSMPGRPFLPLFSSMAWVHLFWTLQGSLSRGTAIQEW